MSGNLFIKNKNSWSQSVDYVCIPAGFDRTSRNCTEDEFRCTNNGCVRLAYRCDGDNDCTDGSDEDNCGMYVCMYVGEAPLIN